MKDFEYLRPETIDEALLLYTKGGSGARLLAGGTELVNEMRLGKTQPEQVIDLKFVREMDFMDLTSDGLRLGALFRVRDAERSLPLQQSPYSVLSHAAAKLGSPQVRNKATIVGNVCRAAPSADLIPPLIALDASVRIVSDKTDRRVDVEDMLLGPGITILEPGDIVTELNIPGMREFTGCGYYKLSPRKSLDLAIVGCAVMIRTDPSISKCLDARIVLGAVAPTVIRANKAESILIDSSLNETVIGEAARAAAGESNPIDDVRASAWYRKRMVEVVTKRSIALALQQIQTRRQ